jgi:hypothetical protein
MDLDSVSDVQDQKAKVDMYREALFKLLAQPTLAGWRELVEHGMHPRQWHSVLSTAVGHRSQDTRS